MQQNQQSNLLRLSPHCSEKLPSFDSPSVSSPEFSKNMDTIRFRKSETMEVWDERRRELFLNEIKSQLHNHRKVSTVSYNLS